MAEQEHTTSALIPLVNNVFEDNSKQAVSARVLHDALGLNPSVYARWAKKNIVKNDFAIEHTDWEITLHEVEYSTNQGVKGRFAQDYLLAIPFAKRLAMMARSAKGEAIRLYFLECERRAQEAHVMPHTPVVRNPDIQMLIDMAVRLDEARTLAEEAKTEAAHASANADRALCNQLFFTIAEYVYVNKLQDQLPKSAYRACSDHLRAYCMDQGIPFRKTAVGGKSWDTEYSFLVNVYTEVLPGWLKRRFAQAPLRVLP